MERRMLAVLVALALAFPAAQATEEPLHDGYLFQMWETVATLYAGLPEDIEPVLPEAGIYRAESVETVLRSVPEGSIAYIEPDYLVTLFDAPDDPRFTEQWGLSMLGAEAAWSIGLDGSGVRIGIIDSGLWAEHEDLAGAQIIPGHNYIDDSGDTSDEVGHGTFVTGLIAAQRGNGLGIAGLAPEAEIVPLKCFSSRTGRMSDIVKAIYGGVNDYHCDILNMSFGVDTPAQALADAIAYAAEQGVILAAAVGNGGTATMNYPAAYDSVIGVGMVDAQRLVAVNSQCNESVFVTAPGYQVLGLGTSTATPYKTGNGTSYACPYVSAATALLLQASPGLTRETLMEFLRFTAVDLGAPGYDTSYGHGLVSLPDLVELFLPHVTREEKLIFIRGTFCSEPDAPLLLASYADTAGRMLGSSILPYQMGGIALTVDSVQEIPASASRVDIYVLEDGMLCPLQPAVRVRL